MILNGIDGRPRMDVRPAARDVILATTMVISCAPTARSRALISPATAVRAKSGESLHASVLSTLAPW